MEIKVTWKVTPKAWKEAMEELGRGAYKRAVGKGVKSGARFSLQSLQLTTGHRRKVDTRSFLEGFRADVTDAGVTLYNVSQHADFVEFGRLPGRMPPVAAISDWAGRKLGDPSLGWPIAKAIAKRGIAPTPILSAESFKEKFAAIMNREVDKAVDAALRKLGA